MSYEDYIALFEDHIEGKAENKREPIASDDENEGQGSNRVPSRKPVSVAKPNTPKKEEKKDGEYGSEAGNTSQMGKTTTSFDLEMEKAKKLKYTVPETCHISLHKRLKIEKLDAKYHLCVHPFPLVEGEMILFQPKKEDQKEAEGIVYRDYSLVKRLETASKPSTAALNK